ncbi:MAG: phosphoribosyltransferase family protein, partial [Bdellovibrionota bacterium]
NPLFVCRGCDRPLHGSDFSPGPFCKPCLHGILNGSIVFRCPRCAGLYREQVHACTGMPDHIRPEIQSISALHLAAGPAWGVLKAWKIHPAPSIQSKVLAQPNQLPEWLSYLRSLGPSCPLLPMPQNFARSWRLGRNPATEIARFLASRLGNGARVIENALASTNPGLPHQGEVATRSDRDQIVRSFRLNENLDDRVVILVDDFVTTGNTIRAAAEALKRVGFQAREVHVAALALRPLLSKTLA